MWNMWRSLANSSLLHQWRSTNLVHELSLNRRLSDHPHPSLFLLPQPPPQQPQPQHEENAQETKIFLMETPLFIASIVIGLLTGLDNYLYSYGLAYLPVPTSSLIVGTQLAFNAIFAFLMVKQKFTPFSINASFY
ncbi:unnamed protein product [Thlaspi arvense]|uniref:Uncharacterized protein n=1 Tax=Thlaspi arvense TaxID=13288 RepID=A0AAU9R5Z0_THLAR|nr:unnamed protein product [Thlaspi arvense]